jgi:L-ascorbate metabolism protein UlaG (beta-lactamase superfamily)
MQIAQADRTQIKIKYVELLLIRNATIKIKYVGKIILVDPMFSKNTPLPL